MCKVHDDSDDDKERLMSRFASALSLLPEMAMKIDFCPYRSNTTTSVSYILVVLIYYKVDVGIVPSVSL